jgi:hypothetical protein
MLRPRIFIENAPAHDDAFAKRFAGMMPRQIASLHVNDVPFEHRPGNLRQRLRKRHQRLQGRRLIDER